jgi:hypothetical protein
MVGLMKSQGFGELLDALDGVAYVTDCDGVIVDVGPQNWTDAAVGFGWNGPSPTALVGLSLFDAITAGDVRTVYRRLHDFVATGGRPRVTFTCRCDQANVVRRMRMSVGAVHSQDGVQGVLYHSQIIAQHERPPLGILMPADAVLALREDTRPIISICSFCQTVRAAGTNEWVQPEEYYRRGGQSDVRISHGVCPHCESSLIESDAKALVLA